MAGEPGRRIEVADPEAYAREHGDQTTHLAPSSPVFEWVLRDLDDFYRDRRREAGASARSSSSGRWRSCARGRRATPWRPGAPTPCPSRGGRRLQMQRLQRAREAYERSRGRGDAAVREALERLRVEAVKADEVLRASGFEVTPVGDQPEVLPPGRPAPAGSVAEPGSARALSDAARARAQALGPLPAASAVDVFTALEVSQPEFLAEGALRESLSRGEVPGVGLEGCTLGGSGIRGLGTDPHGLAARLADLVAGWQRAHLVGPGFGPEEFLGLLLAPEGVSSRRSGGGSSCSCGPCATRA